MIIEGLAVSGLLGISALASLLITDVVRRYATRRAILDVPNHRSLHTVPTPRGGGIGIVAIAFLSVIVARGAGLLSPAVAAALLGGLPVAAVGWIDDRRGVHPAARILVHIAAAVWAVWKLGGLPSIDIGFRVLNLGHLGSFLAVVTIVWLTNLYNFMDGVDGIAATEAVAVAGLGGVFLLLRGDVGLAVVALAICGSSLGFLLRNWSPAKIFMGDVASGFLGFLFGVIAIASERNDTVPLVGWVILLGVFIADATFTLIRRVARGESWYSAHRTHAYQRLVRVGWTHSRISTLVAGLDLVLAALVLVTLYRRDFLLPSLVLAVLTLGILYVIIERFAPFMDLHATNARGSS
jgi:Fuc2NAc and GlcNAc transferase